MADHQPPKRRTVRKINYWRLGIVIGIFITLVGIGTAGGILTWALKDMPAWNPTALEPNMPSYIYDKDGGLVAKIYVENRDPIDFKNVPDTVKSAFLSIEDIRFYDHKGLDLRRIAGASLADIKSGSRAQGASTITQQLVKRAFLSPDKNFKRKIQEAALAIQLERRFTKDNIFEMYLNQIYFGEGAYGIQSAAQVYFGKDVMDLNLEEAALLAALPKAPNSYDPFKDLAAATKRRNIVLANMAKYNFITEDQSKAASARPIALSKESKAKELKNYKFPFFVDYVTELLVDKYGASQVYKGGLNVYTTLDPKIQTAAEEAMANPKNFPKAKYDSKGVVQPQAAVVVLDPKTGFVRALVGGRDHKQKRQFNRATDAVRQPGSTFKPIAVYGPALEYGKTPSSVVNDVPTKFGSWQVRNYDGKYRGYITYRTATAFSVNVAAAKIMNEIGIQKSVAFAKKLGISTLVKDKDDNLSTALGGVTRGVRPIELAAAYGAFDNDGVYTEPTVITKIEDREHNLLEEIKPKKTIAMKKTTAFQMTSMLQSVVTSGTGGSASLGKRPVAAKTGTTSDDKDAWFAGYTPELVCVVWMGHDTPKSMPKVFGGTYPAKIWKSIMSSALKNVPVKPFSKPTGIITATVCSESGLRPSSICPKDSLVKETFTKGTVPSKVCDQHVQITVCAESNQLPTDKCPSVVQKVFIKGQVPTQNCTLHTGAITTPQTPDQSQTQPPSSPEDSTLPGDGNTGTTSPTPDQTGTWQGEVPNSNGQNSLKPNLNNSRRIIRQLIQ